VPDYDRDEAFQRAYAEAAGDPDTWQAFEQRFLHGGEDDYQRAVRAFHDDPSNGAAR
jgi:glutaconate CoA-transferase, subunit A